MNQQQRKHFIQRINAIEESESIRLRDKYTTPEKELSSVERLQLVRSGKVKIKASITQLQEYDEVRNIFDFSKHEKSEKFDQVSYDREFLKIHKRIRLIGDQLMVCDATTAADLLAGLDQ